MTVKKTRDNEQQLALAGTEEGEILARLGERVEKAVATINELRRERDQLKAQLEAAQAKAKESSEAAEKLTSLEEEHDRFRRERGEIRNRIESILGSLESLDTVSDEA